MVPPWIWDGFPGIISDGSNEVWSPMIMDRMRGPWSALEP